MFTPAVFSATLCSLVTVFGALSISAASPQAVVQRHSDAFPDFVVTYAPYTYLHSKVLKSVSLTIFTDIICLTGDVLAV